MTLKGNRALKCQIQKRKLIITKMEISLLFQCLQVLSVCYLELGDSISYRIYD
jgi:hypothetical protein